MSQHTPAQAEFVNLLTSHQRQLFAYIATFLPNPADTEEVLQQTNMLLWSKAEEFTLGTSFQAWAHRVAYLTVIAFRRGHSRERQLFNDELIETMSAEFEDFHAQPATEALRKCLAKLSSGDRELVMRRYSGGTTVKQIAAATGRPASSVYRSIDRIRSWLLDCIQQALSTGEQP